MRLKIFLINILITISLIPISAESLEITRKSSCYLEPCYYYPSLNPCSCKFTRRTKAIVAIAAVYGVAGVWCYFAWYKDQNQAPFRFMNEGWFGSETYAGGTDKLGHAYANFLMVRGFNEILKWGDFDCRYAPLLASALTLSYFTAVEIKDGTGFGRDHERIAKSYDYGFSWEDMTANIVGNLLALVFIYFPVIDEMFDYRLEYWPSPEYMKLLKEGNVNSVEDYSGMYYGLWYHLSSIPAIKCNEQPVVRLLKYIDIGVGYHTDGFMPKPEGIVARRRQIYFGITANLQQIFDDLFFNGGRCCSVARDVTHCFNEFITVPGTVLHIPHNLKSGNVDAP